MRHRRQAPAMRAALLTFRAARLGLPLSAIPVSVVLAVWLCLASTPAP